MKHVIKQCLFFKEIINKTLARHTSRQLNRSLKFCKKHEREGGREKDISKENVIKYSIIIHTCYF